MLHVILIAAFATQADERRINDQILGAIERIQITISDEVTDGCWTNIEEIKQQVEDNFDRANIEVVDEEEVEVIPQYYIDVYGNMQSESCYVVWTMSILFPGCLSHQSFDGQLCTYFAYQPNSGFQSGLVTTINDAILRDVHSNSQSIIIDAMANR